MDYKEIYRETYDRYAEEFQEKTKDYLRYISQDFKEFVRRVNGFRVLDLGCGPGRDSVCLKNTGFQVVGFDISMKMLRLREEKGVKVVQGDLEDLPFLDSTFCGVWAYTSLLNIPKKKFPDTLREIKRVLKSDGRFYIGMKEGRFEGDLESDKYPGCRRFFSLYEKDELEDYLRL